MNNTFSAIKIMHRAVQEAEEKDERSHRERERGTATNLGFENSLINMLLFPVVL